MTSEPDLTLEMVCELEEPLSQVCFDASGRLWTLFEDKLGCLDLKRRAPLAPRSVEAFQGGAIHEICLSPDGGQLALFGHGKDTSGRELIQAIVDVQSGRVLRSYAHTLSVPADSFVFGNAVWLRNSGRLIMMAGWVLLSIDPATGDLRELSIDHQCHEVIPCAMKPARVIIPLALRVGGSEVDSVLYDVEGNMVWSAVRGHSPALQKAIWNEEERTLMYFDGEAIVHSVEELPSLSSGRRRVALVDSTTADESSNWDLRDSMLTSDGTWLVTLLRHDWDDHGRIELWDTQEGTRATAREFGFLSEWAELHIAPDNSHICVCNKSDGNSILLELGGASSATLWRREWPWELGEALTAEDVPDGWQGCPLSLEVIRLLISLGARYTGPARPEAGRTLPAHTCWNTASGERWSDRDPRGEFEVIAPAPYSLTTHISWDNRQFVRHDRLLERQSEIAMIGGASEQPDVVDGGKRMLIHFIAEDEAQYYWGIDLLDRGLELPVYRVDHDLHDAFEAPYKAYDSLASFLRGLAPGIP